jgi:hypothetical protein
MGKKIFFLLWASCTYLSGKGQEINRPPLNLEIFVQEFLAQQEEEMNYEDIYENLLQFYQNPIDLNNTTAEELNSLLLLTPSQINNLIKHIQENGNLLSLYELQAIPGFDLITVNRILPFVAVPEAGLLTDRKALGQRILNSTNHYLLTRYDRVLQTRRGYTAPDTIGNRLTSRYAGSPDKFLLRYRNSHARDFSLGFTAEKDAGEALQWNPDTHRYGLDFYSAHFQVYNKGKLKALALGDYQLQFGQGLLLSSGFSVGKGSETITTVRRSNVGIRPYSSVLESGFFRGVAATYAVHPNVNITGFLSRKKADASLQPETDSLAEFDFSFSGIQVSGLHRTANEIQNKNQLTEMIYGTNATYTNNSRNLNAGLTLLQTVFNLTLQRQDANYTAFDFSGRRNLAMSLNYSYNWRNISMFGESARSSGGGLGTVNGLIASLSRNVDVSYIYRNYGKSFTSFYGNAFGENTRNRNETGFYTGAKVKPNLKWEITAYYDFFRFPWLKYRVDAPSHGQEYLVRVLFKPNKKALLYGQFRRESKGLNYQEPGRQLKYVLPANRRNYLLYLDFSPVPALSLRSRVQFSEYIHGQPTTTGYYISQEFISTYRSTTFSARYALFDTDDYNSRQYVTERDVLSAFSVPAFYGTGTRVYLLVQKNIGPKLDAWLKVAHTQYRNQKTIGSGLEQITGAARSDVRCQLRYKF